MTISSLLFIAALGLVNADGNITSIDLQNKSLGVIESNPLAAPLAEGDTHYINNAVAIGGCIVAHDLLKDFDAQHHWNDFGTKDVFTLGVIGLECVTLSHAAAFQSKGGVDVGGQLFLSEVEVGFTCGILNLQF